MSFAIQEGVVPNLCFQIFDFTGETDCRNMEEKVQDGLVAVPITGTPVAGSLQATAECELSPSAAFYLPLPYTNVLLSHMRSLRPHGHIEEAERPIVEKVPIPHSLDLYDGNPLKEKTGRDKIRSVRPWNSRVANMAVPTDQVVTEF
ncbi:hypothetical protein AAF712_002264 [Marasmius tenuissimus]|uniref:Uncharacterized protein n=1 Tax=Marasmius tenuissimus TaxID=585030 RepID=A0ABR3AA22_9AGAR